MRPASTGNPCAVPGQPPCEVASVWLVPGWIILRQMWEHVGFTQTASKPVPCLFAACVFGRCLGGEKQINSTART